jgi:NAD(P)-dependent dehydrogenase (short-subunit alcohol dehydrogenase family)
MLDAGKGSIVTTASAAGLVGVPGVFAYSAAKGGVISLTRQVAAEYGPRGIRANTICPGTVYTPLVQRTYAERSGADSSTEAAISKEIADKYPLRRMGTPEAIANAALYLASDESEWTTGAVFSIDGGLTAI